MLTPWSGGSVGWNIVPKNQKMVPSPVGAHAGSDQHFCDIAVASQIGDYILGWEIKKKKIVNIMVNYDDQ